MKNILYFLVSLFLMSSCNSKEGIHQVDVNHNCKANVITQSDLVNLLYSKDMKGIQFVDIRTPHQFAVGHIRGSINIPANNFFDNDKFYKLGNDDMLILYGDDATKPKLLSMISGHFRKGKFYVALGGYDYIESKILQGTGFYSGQYDDEVALVDFQKVVNEIKSRSGAAPSKTSKSSAPAKPIIKRKKKEVSGGCG